MTWEAFASLPKRWAQCLRKTLNSDIVMSVESCGLGLEVLWRFSSSRGKSFESLVVCGVERMRKNVMLGIYLGFSIVAIRSSPRGLGNPLLRKRSDTQWTAVTSVGTVQRRYFGRIQCAASLSDVRDL